MVTIIQLIQNFVVIKQNSLRCISIMNNKPIINRLVRTYSNSTGIIVSQMLLRIKIMMGRPDYFIKLRL
jgi:hypothetical protein